MLRRAGAEMALLKAGLHVLEDAGALAELVELAQLRSPAVGVGVAGHRGLRLQVFLLHRLDDLKPLLGELFCQRVPLTDPLLRVIGIGANRPARWGC